MHTVPRVIRPLVYPAALLYGAVGRIRNAFYDSRLLPTCRLDGPTISIGNITTGGTGKTPLVVYTALKVLELGFTPVILTRGYGRNAPGRPLSIDPGTQLWNPSCIMGDEPALIRRHVPQARFGIGKNRFKTGSRLDGLDPKTVFILDDGFQHRKLHRDLDIVVVDTTQPLFSDRMFPLGSLREPIRGLHRCDSIILNGSKSPERDSESVVSEIKSVGLKADLFYCDQHIQSIVPFEIWTNKRKTSSDTLSVRSALLVAALGNPLRFRRDVEKFGVRVAGTQFYRDHHILREVDWKACIRAARDVDADAILITEKDAIKITSRPDFPLFVSVQAIRILNEEAYVELIRRCLKDWSKVECQTSNV